ncbi:TonB family protein [Lysobacter antibioticus]|uniref:Protein TonB n=1 Tax=Lysobacter antibioticus TaxID=84531 RepID=A0A0S2F5Y3_LYSAN|nr:TonB family protein [Lysobacter antibioticus]ALN78952.1 tonB family C-terminal domain protein [Lysobacter antibioticus]
MKPVCEFPAGRWSKAGVRAIAGLALGVALGGCGSEAPHSAASPAPLADAALELPAPLDELDIEGLRARATQALREQRIHTPAGDSAVDYYLALRDKEPGQIDVIGALDELQPYVVIAGEQALLDDDLAESHRLLDLLARMDPQAPALPRMRESLRVAEASRERKTREETERLMAERTDAATVLSARREAARTANAALANAAMKADAAASALAADAAAAKTGSASAAQPVAASAATPAAALPAMTSANAASPAMPRLLADASPRYPLPALNRKIEGSVEVSFTILPDGRVGAPRLVSSEPAGVFDAAALAAVARLRFEASGQSHTARRTLNFRLPSR